MKILVLGPSGQIGHEVASQASKIAEVVTAGRSSADVLMDPLDNKALDELFAEIQPDIVINAIAYTAVDKAESDIDLAYKLNADLPAALADQCAKLNCLLIHYSTDFVFDGTDSKPLIETSMTNPLSIYGKTKLAGEKAIQTSVCPNLILRTSWVYGERGGNFLLTMLRLARERETLSVVNDQIGSPSCSRDIAKATISLCQRYFDDPEYVRSNTGIYHLTATGETSWYGFAKAIFDYGDEDGSLIIKELLPISTDQYPTPAVRPQYSVLNCQHIKEKFGIEMANWRTALQACIKRCF